VTLLAILAIQQSVSFEPDLLMTQYQELGQTSPGSSSNSALTIILLCPLGSNGAVVAS
jgi:hypothetical protein